MSKLIPKRQFIASPSVYTTKYFTNVFFFNISARSKSGEFKLLTEVIRRGQNQ